MTATLSQSELQGLANLAKIGNAVDADLKAIAKHDQNTASERDKLVKRGFALVGAGLTIERIEWANDVLAYAVNMGENTKAGAQRVIGELQRSILHMANDLTSDATGKTGKLRTFNDSLQLALVAKSIGHVKFLDWGVAVQFNRFLADSSPVKPAIEKLEEGKALAGAIMLKKPEFLNKNGFLDKKAIRAAIDAILGKSRKSKEKTEGESAGDETDDSPSVTSAETVAKWLSEASAADIASMMKLLPEKTAESVIMAMVDGAKK